MVMITVRSVTNEAELETPQVGSTFVVIRAALRCLGRGHFAEEASTTSARSWRREGLVVWTLQSL